MANCAVQAIREGHPCTERKNRSTSPAGVLPSVRCPPEAPKGFPRQWSFSSPGAHDDHPHRGPPNQGRSPPANADDGAAHRRRLAVKGVPAIPLLIQGALRQREGGHSSIISIISIIIIIIITTIITIIIIIIIIIIVIIIIIIIIIVIIIIITTIMLLH